MSIPSSKLLTSRRFLPLFLTQFFGAFNDNIFKNALVILITYRIAVQTGDNAQLLITLAAGLFILPFLLFSALAGQLADKYEKSRLISFIKLAELILMVLASLGFYLQNITLLMMVLFLLGVQSTFFGPLKYAMLPFHLHKDELIAGNALVESGTFLAILIGTILGGILILSHAGVLMVCVLTLAVAISGWLSSRYIPRALAAAPQLKISYNIFSQTWDMLNYSRKSKDVFLSILGISWFWLIGATFLSQFPTFAKVTLSADGGVVTLFLTLFSIGIGLGSQLCSKIMRGRIEATYVPLAALGMTIFMVDLFFASRNISATTHLASVGQFLSHLSSWRIMADLLLIAILGGVYIVPLYAILQSRSEESHRSRTIAGNNVVNALFMVVAALVTVLLLAIGFSVPLVFLTAGIANAFIALYICKLLPDALVKSLLRSVLTFFFRVEVRGLSHYHNSHERLLIVANHTSLLDAALIAAFLPEKLVFAINTHIAQKWWLKPFLLLVDVYAIDPTNPMATKSLIELVRNGKKCLIFPEGRITVTGSLMKIYEGPGMIADKANAKILPIRIEGAQYSPFSYLRGKVRIRFFPKITLTILTPRHFSVPDTLKGRKRRYFAGLALYDLMTDMLFESSRQQQTLFASLLQTSIIHGKKHRIAEDIQRQPLNYQQFISRSFILGRAIAKNTQPQEYVGILLPNMVSTAITFFAMQAFGRIPAMLNFSTGVQNVLAACTMAKLQSVYTARAFIKNAKLEPLIDALVTSGMQIVYLEDMAKSISWLDKLRGLVATHFASWYYQSINRSHSRQQTNVASGDTPAVVLYTSGSEGTPKGVVLSHNNILANSSQLSSRIDFGPTDRIFNALPLFHSFGLTGGTLLPLLSGIKVFFYPSPLHYRIVPELVYDTNATILFGTDTFLSGYAKYASGYDFYSIRYVFAGAEKLKETTRKIWSEQFGVRIFEGYGATETSPILSSNTPMHSKPGTVGRFMPGIQYHLEPIVGNEHGGRLIVSGPNVMLGYLTITNPGILLAPNNQQYDTGDIVDIDAEGFITILGRAKRFAKIGGEMVSLPAIEHWLNDLWPGYMHAVVSIPAEKKGEQVVLLTDYASANREEIINYARSHGINELSIPRKILIAQKIPLLGSGKVDYQAVLACFTQLSAQETSV